MKAAVIDLGTNTFHLIIAEHTGQSFTILYKTNVPVKLGEGRINENIIISDAFDRGIAALKSFKEEIDKHNVSSIAAIATSAIRSASNGIEFVKQAKITTGIDITVIDGDTEAEYIYKGVKAIGILDEMSLIIDIGGGSTEFIICDKEVVLWKRSFDLGAARLLQAYFHSDPINQHDQNLILNKLTKELEPLKIACQNYQPQHLIGSAGAFETFAGMIDKNINISSSKYAAINLASYDELANKLIESSNMERQKLEGLITLRVDMIVIASLITNYVLTLSSFKKMSVSTYDLKMGVLYSELDA